MKFIHTADLHLGNQMHDIDRREEVAAFFHWLREQIIQKNAETLIIAGDIFDSANPPVEARRFYYAFLASLSVTCCKNVIVIGGNHDSALMLESSKELLELLNIRVAGSVSSLGNSPEKMCFELFDQKGDSCAIAMAVPFVREIELRNYYNKNLKNKENDDSELPDSALYSIAYKKIYEDVFEEAKKLRGDRNIPIIATGHLYAQDLEGKEPQKNEDNGMKAIDVRGTLGNVPSSVFPDADYVALGHIHYSTMVAKNPAIRYSGSPFVMGFDEAEKAHYILFGEIDLSLQPSEKLRIEKIETPRTFLYRRICGSLSEIKEQLEKYQENTEVNKKLFLEVSYIRQAALNAQEYLDETIQKLPKNISVASWRVLDSEKFFNEFSEGFDSSEIQNLDDDTVFRQLILSKTGYSAESEEGKSLVEKFLPLFLQVANEESGE